MASSVASEHPAQTLVAGQEIRAKQLERLLSGGEPVHLRRAIVRGDVVLPDGAQLQAEGSVFKGKISRRVDEISGVPSKSSELRGTEVIFERGVDLYLDRFGAFECRSCRFDADLELHSVVAESLWLVDSVITGHLVLVAAEIGSLNLADAELEKTADLIGGEFGEFNSTRLRTSEPVRITWGQFGDDWAEDEIHWATAIEGEDREERVAQVESELRFWKANFTELDEPRDALEANFRLIQLKRDHEWGVFDIDWYASRLLEVPNRYGTRPYRPLLWALFFVPFFGVLYWRFGAFEAKKASEPPQRDRKPEWLFSLLYSFDTFVPVFNLSGVKEWGWAVKAEYRWVEVVERAIGVLFAAAAAYSVASYLV
jgi:hypothetical protein